LHITLYAAGTQRRNSAPALTRRLEDGTFIRFGLTEEGRQLAYEGMCETASLPTVPLPAPPAPLTPAELSAIVEANGARSAFPDRFIW
jgi:hypothetical protein